MIKFEHDGKSYTAVSELRDTDFGPEIRVRFYNQQGEQIGQ